MPTIDRQLGEGVVAPDDPQPAGGQPAEGAATDDLAAMVRVLEHRCRDAEGRAKLAEQGRRQYELMLRQQQVQTDIAAERRGEAEDAYQRVRTCLGQVAVKLREGGGPDAEGLAENLLAVAGGGSETSSSWPPPALPPRLAPELSDRLVRLTRAAALSRSTQRHEWTVRSLCAVAGAVALSLVLGNVGVSSLSVAGVQVAAPEPVVPAPGTREADEAWAAVATELDGTWERDWPRTIALLAGFLKRWPTYAMAQDKLYAALVADGDVHVHAGQVSAGVDELERAARLLPERAEAWALLTQLATSEKT